MHLEEVAALLHRTDWAKDRTVEELIRKSMENACPYGLFLSDCISEGGDRQIGFARVLTDGVTTFYLMDLVIEKAYRGQGFGRNHDESDYEGNGIRTACFIHKLQKHFMKDMSSGK